MTKPQPQVAVLAGLVVVMVAVYLKPRGRGPSTTATPPQAAQEPADLQSPATFAPASSAPSADRAAQRERAAHLSWRRDPFTRGGSAAGMSGLRLTGILWDPTAPIAVLNGEMRQVGEEVDGYRIMAIDRDRVSISDGTETLQILVTP
jgi:hypothetical protein